MSGTITPPTNIGGGFFQDNTVTVAAGLDLQNLVAQAIAAVAAVEAVAGSSMTPSATLAAAILALPTSPEGLSTGSPWNNGNTLAIAP